MKEEIEMLLATDARSAKIPMAPINDINKVLLYEFGYEIHSFNRDGWETAFWGYYRKNEEYLCLSGSLYYGNFKLTKINKEEL